MRILKKIIRKIYHLIWFLSIFLFFIPIVNAEPSISNFSINSYSLQPNNGFVSGTPSSNKLRFDIQSDGQITYIRNIYCFDSRVTSWTSNLPTTQLYDVIFYNTNQKCTYYGSNYDGGYVTYFYATYEPTQNPSASLVITFDTSSNFSIGLFDYSVSHTPYQYIFSQPDESVQVNIDTNGIINSQNQSSQNIINNQDSNTQSIIDSSESNTQSIIDNNNQNTQQEIDSQKVCNTKKYSYNNSSYQENSYLTINGQINQNYNYSISDYIDIGTNSTLEITEKATTGSGYLNTCFYNENKTLISCTSTYNIQSQLTIPDNTKFVRFTFRNNDLPLYELSTCIGGNQALNDTLTDDSTPDIDLDLTTASDTPISDLITMPLTILNGLYQTLTDSCTNYTLPFFYSTTITFPCFTISDYLGTNITNYIDLFICLYMCYNIAMLVISVFEDITSLRDIYDSLYEPKHAYTGYHPRHAKGE